MHIRGPAARGESLPPGPRRSAGAGEMVRAGGPIRTAEPHGEGRDPYWVGAALWRSLLQSRVTVGAYHLERQNLPPPTWDEAVRHSRRRVEEQLRKRLVPRGAPQLTAALQKYLACLRRWFVEPARHKSATVPVELRALCWQAAELVEQLVLLDPTVRRAEYILRTGDSTKEPPTVREASNPPARPNRRAPPPTLCGRTRSLTIYFFAVPRWPDRPAGRTACFGPWAPVANSLGPRHKRAVVAAAATDDILSAAMQDPFCERPISFGRSSLSRVQTLRDRTSGNIPI